MMTQRYMAELNVEWGGDNNRTGIPCSDCALRFQCTVLQNGQMIDSEKEKQKMCIAYCKEYIRKDDSHHKILEDSRLDWKDNLYWEKEKALLKKADEEAIRERVNDHQVANESTTLLEYKRRKGDKMGRRKGDSVEHLAQQYVMLKVEIFPEKERFNKNDLFLAYKAGYEKGRG